MGNGRSFLPVWRSRPFTYLFICEEVKGRLLVICHVSRKGMDSLLSEDDKKKVQDASTVLKNLSEGNEAGRESSCSSSGRPTGESSSGVGGSSGRPTGASSSGAGASSDRPTGASSSGAGASSSAGASSGTGTSSAVSGTSGSKSTGDLDSPSCSGIFNSVVLSN